ncbi:MerR family DNA-binding protein [Streptomyces broussonetiae]|uniref:MerR family DNA-binding protein n=1 Tax=Streptomyces broussonetiae TaxID=2686304 RepID=A0ABV5EAI9_9ACTN
MARVAVILRGKEAGLGLAKIRDLLADGGTDRRRVRLEAHRQRLQETVDRAAPVWNSWSAPSAAPTPPWPPARTSPCRSGSAWTPGRCGNERASWRRPSPGAGRRLRHVVRARR